MADPLTGVICTCSVRDHSALVAHTNTGLSHEDDGQQQPLSGFTVLKVDRTLVGRAFTEITVHEFTHDYFPDMKEAVVEEFARQLTDLLYVPVIRKTGALDV